MEHRLNARRSRLCARLPPWPAPGRRGKILNDFKARDPGAPSQRARQSVAIPRTFPSAAPPAHTTAVSALPLFRPGFARRETCAMHPGARNAAR